MVKQQETIRQKIYNTSQQSHITIKQHTQAHIFDNDIRFDQTALEQLALANLPEFHTKPKLLNVPFYNFVCCIVNILTEYCKSSPPTECKDVVIFNLNGYIVDFYFRKYETNPSEIYRQLFSLLRSWKKYTQHHQQAKLFLSLLTPERNTVESVKVFLKFRKCILKSLNQKILQQLQLTHQDALTITHTLFSLNHDVKNFVTKKINQLFISLKRKLINSAKVNGAVMCEFFMGCAERFQDMDINKLFGEVKAERKKIHRTLSNTKKLRQQSKSPLKQRLPNNTLPDIQSKSKLPDDAKYNLSFSQQYASYYSPQQQDLESSQKKINQQQQNQNSGEFMSNFEQLENEWRRRAIQGEAPINLVRNSLNFFKKKDQEIDLKLNNYKKYHNYQQHNHDKQNNLKDDFGENINYPEGWEKFIKTNARTKKKLMSHRKIQQSQV